MDLDGQCSNSVRHWASGRTHVTLSFQSESETHRVVMRT